MLKSFFGFGELILLAATLIWGTAFLFQSTAMAFIDPYMFVIIRSLIATIGLGSFVVIRGMVLPKRSLSKLGTKKGYMLAIFTGITLAIAMMTQQVAIVNTPIGKAGFLTSLYLVFVPVVGLFFKQRIRYLVLLGLIPAVIGFYFLTGIENFYIQGSDLLLIVCAFAYAFQIQLIQHIKHQLDSMMIAFVQFAVATLFCIPFLFLFGSFDLTFIAIPSVWLSLLYVGVVSSCIAYSLQIIGQKRSANAFVASFFMSTEAIVATLSGVYFLAEILRTEQVVGMSLIFIAVVYVSVMSQMKKKIPFFKSGQLV
jgi:drug/metabolite transporter (DMT)-like permease